MPAPLPTSRPTFPSPLLSFESANDVWGTSTNPYNKNYTSGGSTGGEGALLALGGRIGVGSDVAGSVRCPAHFSGIYSLKCSTGRWMKLGTRTSMPGQDGIPAVYSPMARTLNDLTYFTRSIIQMKPWKYDYPKKPTWKRSSSIASQLLDADGVQTAMSFFRTGEGNDRGVSQMRFYFNLTRVFNMCTISGSDMSAVILSGPCEAYKCRWFDFWEEKGFDFIVAPPNATPAVPHGGMRDACSSCGYTFLFNLKKDQLPKGFNVRNLNGVARGAYRHYNADNIHGLPVGVQVIGRRLEEERVLALMKRVEGALGDGKLKLLELDLDGGVEHKFDH
ncbi:hypothetical protein MY1884_002316 [Beauveria asiatica]